jgi:hypothetical protein
MKDAYLFQVLIQNLPTKVHCSQNKSGAFSKASVATHIALKHFNFIEVNSKERITIVVFDKDLHEGITALDYFQDLITFQEWLIDKINIQPTYICQTSKGFQFGFVIKGFMRIQNGYSPKNSPEQYLNDIKKRFIQYLLLDEVASSRNSGIFRNPIRHKYIAFPSKIYNLNDLYSAVEHVKIDRLSYQINKPYISISKYKKINSNRNNSIYKLCCREFAYSKKTTLTKIFSFANDINNRLCYEPLPLEEIKSISKSIYKSIQNKTLRSATKKAQVNREGLVKDRKKQIIKYILKCKKKNEKVYKVNIAKELGITVQALNSTYGSFLKIKYKI